MARKHGQRMSKAQRIAVFHIILREHIFNRKTKEETAVLADVSARTIYNLYPAFQEWLKSVNVDWGDRDFLINRYFMRSEKRAERLESRLNQATIEDRDLARLTKESREEDKAQIVLAQDIGIVEREAEQHAMEGRIVFAWGEEEGEADDEEDEE